MRKTLAVLLACGLPLLGGWDWLTSPNRDVEKGNRLFQEGKYQEALEAFRKAEEVGGDPARLQYNLGTAYYKMAESLSEGEDRRDELFEKAEIAFRRAAESRDPVLKSSSYYNAGNALFQRDNYGEAVEAYRKALRSHPQNDQARYNLELALRRLERQQQRRPPQPEEDKEKKGGEADRGGDGSPGGDRPEPPPQEKEDREGSDGSDQKPGADRPQGDEGSPDSEPAPESDSRPEPEAPEEGRSGESSETTPPEVPPARPGWGEESDAEGEPLSESERKLDALERRSRELRKRRLRRGSRRSRGHDRLEPKKDW